MKNRKSKKYQSVITKRIFQSVKKLSKMFLVVACATSLLTVPGTNAGFSDIEESTGNIFAALSLDGEPRLVELFSVTGLEPGDAPNETTTFENVGTLDFQYGVKYAKVAGDDALCDVLILTAKREGIAVYGPLLLKDFNVAGPVGTPFVIPVAGEDSWNFTVELPEDADEALENKTCQWSFDFTAWQTDAPDATEGFSDFEVVATHSVSTGEWLTGGDVVINEVMWMGSTESTADEWIELKNMTDKPINIGKWKIENAKIGPVDYMIPANKVIPANGYFLISNYPRTSAHSALDIAPDDTSAGLSLSNNNNGNLVLKTSAGLVIDRALGAESWPAGTNDTLKQSMERNDLSGDGLLASSWHTCVSGAANGAPYWDAAGVNYGTPKAPNLSPIVMNEFVLNPVGDDDTDQPDGEWVELYNIVDESIDVTGWYFTNADGDQIAVTEENTDSATTVVPAKGALVVYLEAAFLDNTADTLSLYAPGRLPEDASDDVREDIYSYMDADLFLEGKSYARFPDGEGIWIDPEPTPGEENVMPQTDMQIFQRLTYDRCFENEQLKNDATEEICSPIFLSYIGMLEAVDETTIPNAVLLDILEMIRLEEQEILATLLDDGIKLSLEEAAPVGITAAASLEPVEGEENIPESVESAEREATDETTAETESVEVVTPIEVEAVPETEPTEGTESPLSVEGVENFKPAEESESGEETSEEKIGEVSVDKPEEPASETP